MDKYGLVTTPHRYVSPIMSNEMLNPFSFKKVYLLIPISCRFPVHGNRVDGIWLHFPHTIKEFLAQIPHAKFIECDYHRAQVFLNKNPQDNTEEAKQFLRKGRQLLSRGKEILDDLGVPFWLSSGTCLGEIVVTIVTREQLCWNGFIDYYCGQRL